MLVFQNRSSSSRLRRNEIKIVFRNVRSAGIAIHSVRGLMWDCSVPTFRKGRACIADPHMIMGDRILYVLGDTGATFNHQSTSAILRITIFVALPRTDKSGPPSFSSDPLPASGSLQDYQAATISSRKGWRCSALRRQLIFLELTS